MLPQVSNLLLWRCNLMGLNLGPWAMYYTFFFPPQCFSATAAEMYIGLHWAFTNTLYIISRKSKLMGLLLRCGRQDLKDKCFSTFFFFCHKAHSVMDFSKHCGRSQKEQDNLKSWSDKVCYSWLHCVQFYKKDMSSNRNRLVFMQRSESKMRILLTLKVDCF